MVVWGWTLLGSGVITLALLTYRFIWLERYRYPFRMAHDAVRLRGRITGKEGTVVYCVSQELGEELLANAFTLRCKEGPERLVAPSGSVLGVRGHRHEELGRIRGIMVGDRVTIDGIPTTQSRDENLYREPGRVPVVEAVRIAGGSWPELRWLRFPAAIGALAFLLSLGQILFAPGAPVPFAAPGEPVVTRCISLEDLPPAGLRAYPGNRASYSMEGDPLEGYGLEAEIDRGILLRDLVSR
jgi:hypothetical protein